MQLCSLGLLHSFLAAFSVPATLALQTTIADAIRTDLPLPCMTSGSWLLLFHTVLPVYELQYGLANYRTDSFHNLILQNYHHGPVISTYTHSDAVTTRYVLIIIMTFGLHICIL